MLPGSSRTSMKMMHRDRHDRGDERCESFGDEAVHGTRTRERRAGACAGPPLAGRPSATTYAVRSAGLKSVNAT